MIVPAPRSSRQFRRERQHAAFREDVLAEACAILAEEGPNGLSMRKLAHRMGCAPMSLYAHFRDKHDLLTALAHRGFGILAERLAAEPEEEPLSALRAVFLTYARLGLERPDDYRVLFMTPEVQPVRQFEGPDEIAGESPAFAIGLDRARACVTAGMMEGDAHAITTLLWTAVHGAVAAVLTFPAFPFGDRDAYVERVVDGTIDGLRAAKVAPLA